jgi:hypothetical protein
MPAFTAPPRVRNLISQVPGAGGVCVGWLADNGPSDPTATGKLQYTFGLGMDVLLDKMWWGIAARFPGIGTPTALPYIAKDRGLVRGLTETDAAFSVRLAAWLDSWQRAGSPRAVLQQVIGYLGSIRARTVDDSGNWCTYIPGDNPALFGPSTSATGTWDWDAEGDPHPLGQAAWWRWWLIVYSTSASGASWAGTEGTWGDGDVWGDDAKSWGLGVPPGVASTLKAAIVRTWKRAGSWCRWILVSMSDTLFDPFQVADDIHNPLGDFGHWSKIVNRSYVPARFSNARYCDGVATNGIPTGFPYF